MVRTFGTAAPSALSSFLARAVSLTAGTKLGLFTYDCEVAVPDWIAWKDANEICLTDHIVRYQRDLDCGRVELDIVILGGELLADETFFPIERDSLMRATISVLNFYGNWRCKMLDRVFNTA
jgi:hypothetical protein